MNQSRPIVPKLLFIFSLFWILLAINPKYRDIWVAENIILTICLIWLLSKAIISLSLASNLTI